MTKPIVPDPARTSAQLRAAADLLARARRDLAAGGAPDLQALLRSMETIDRELARVPAASAHTLRPALLTLLDEAARLTADLQAQRTELAARLRAASTHLRAGTAYRRAGKA